MQNARHTLLITARRSRRPQLMPASSSHAQLPPCTALTLKNSWPTAPLTPTMASLGPLATLPARTTKTDRWQTPRALAGALQAPRGAPRRATLDDACIVIKRGAPQRSAAGLVGRRSFLAIGPSHLPAAARVPCGSQRQRGQRLWRQCILLLLLLLSLPPPRCPITRLLLPLPLLLPLGFARLRLRAPHRRPRCSRTLAALPDAALHQRHRLAHQAQQQPAGGRRGSTPQRAQQGGRQVGPLQHQADCKAGSDRWEGRRANTVGVEEEGQAAM